jgi:hypothetical protein
MDSGHIVIIPVCHHLLVTKVFRRTTDERKRKEVSAKENNPRSVLSSLDSFSTHENGGNRCRHRSGGWDETLEMKSTSPVSTSQKERVEP